jgi:hypothetical protein
VAIDRLPNDHLYLSCDTPNCTLEGITMHAAAEADLEDYARGLGWHVAFGLHYCPLTTIHQCEVCGAGTRSSLTDVATGEVEYYCDEHWPDLQAGR